MDKALQKRRNGLSLGTLGQEMEAMIKRLQEQEKKRSQAHSGNNASKEKNSSKPSRKQLQKMKTSSLDLMQSVLEHPDFDQLEEIKEKLMQGFATSLTIEEPDMHDSTSSPASAHKAQKCSKPKKLVRVTKRIDKDGRRP